MKRGIFKDLPAGSWPLYGINKYDFVKSLLGRHPGESRGPDGVPAKAGNQKYMNLDSCFHRKPWIPAFAGMTNSMEFRLFTNSSKMKGVCNACLLWEVL